MDFPNLGEEPRKQSFGEKEQEYAGVVIMAARLFLSLELDRDAVASVIHSVLVRWPSFRG